MISFVFRFLLVFVLFFFITGCGGLQMSGGVEKNWQQYYEPVESWQAVNFAHEAFAEAVRLYGPPAVPIGEIHIRQSVKRRHPARFSRADIVDWRLFVSFLSANRQAYPVSRFWENLSGETRSLVAKYSASRKVMSVAEQLLLIEDLNRLVQSRSLYDASYFAQFMANRPALNKLGAGYLRLKKKKLERFNRRLIGAMFTARIILPYRERRWVPEGLELCEMADSVAGRVVLYVSSPDTAPEFYLQLAHESLHLLNPSLYDWYMEGLGNVFAEQMAARNHLDWSPWQQRFASRCKKDPYAIAYNMMREIVAVAGNDMATFLKFAVYSGQPDGRMRLDIDGWLAGLNQEKQKRILAILRQYGPQINRYRGQRNSIVLPASLRRAPANR